jgi:type I restriction enzyme M protein
MEQVTLDIGDVSPAVGAEESAQRPPRDDEIIDYISGEPIKPRPNEEVRQRLARALFHEYGISVDDMKRDFPIPVVIDGRKKTKKADIAIFKPGTGGKPNIANLTRVVICKPEPKGGRAVTKVRTYQQAEAELSELKDLLGTEATPDAKYGMWTNGLDFFFIEKETTKFGANFVDRADWPMADESIGVRSVGSAARLRRGEAGMLKVAFRRCHNYIHGNEGMPKDAAFWQFLYLIFCKMHDERVSRRSGRAPQFFALPSEPFTDDGRRAISERIYQLFNEVKQHYHRFFTQRDELTLSPRALAFIVGELSSYDFTGTDMDAKGIAYQELVGTNLRGDRGQYFTPLGAVKLMVEILDPQPHQKVLDPACGTGGFLRETLSHLLRKWKEEDGTTGLPDTESQLERIARFAKENLYGADFDPFLVRATTLSLMSLTGGIGNVYYMNSLAFPHSDLPGNDEAKQTIPMPGSVDIVMTNPPFGTDIKIEDPKVLDQYRYEGVAQPWTRDRGTGEITVGANPVSSMAPEQLFIQRAVEWVRPGGKIGIVLPNGILSNPGPVDEAIRRWILEHCWVLASIELPVETFIVEANVNILTTLLFLKKKTPQERETADMGGEQDYPVFMAVAEKVGKDRRNNDIYKRRPDGEPIVEEHTEIERFQIGERIVERKLVRKRKVIDNDLPVIAAAYHAFRVKYPEPGSP